MGKCKRKDAPDIQETTQPEVQEQQAVQQEPAEEVVYEGGKPWDQMSKSDKIRALSDRGCSVAQIARQLQTHYSFVYSVVKKHKEQLQNPGAARKESKSQKIRELYDQDAKITEIARTVGVDYAFVYNVIRQYKAKKEGNR